MRRSRAPSRAALLTASQPLVCRATSNGNDTDKRGKMEPAQEMKLANTAALQQGSINVVRAPMLGCLTVPRGPGLVAGAFKLPGGARRTENSESLLRRKSLGVRRPVNFMTPSKFRKPGTGSPEPSPVNTELDLEDEGSDATAAPAPAVDEKPFEPLVLWEAGPAEDDHRINVDPRLCKWLRPHQREGVQFMFECVMGMRDFEGNGCILADDMGLGKTLQSITVLWTLLKQSQEKGVPAVKRAIVVCPTSLVKNWEAEIDKWLKGDCRVIALSETTRDQVVQSINLFLAGNLYKVLIVSYETFRLHSKRFYAKADSCCDLLICDEAHRLKNAETATNQALGALKCRRRILLSGTPMQNDLEEFYAMTDFTNPGVLGTGSSFRKKFLAPILAGREPSATEKQVERAQKCQNEMSTVVNEFILRRTNNINAKHLPPKLTQVVCCRLTPLQNRIYRHLLSSKEIRHILNGKQTNILSSIGAMQKLCNHPKILVEGSSAGRDRDSGMAAIASLLPSSNPSAALAGEGRGGVFGAGSRRGGGAMQKGVFPEWSGKMETLFRLMREMRRAGDDRIVVVSNYTQSLDLIGSMCRENSWPFVRLDGSTGVSKRQKMVDAFNQPGPHSFAFLLSSKAGGCGLNLIGANRLVLFDPDWNPAIDKQAAARVWRDGQKKRCFVYRFVSTGTIEEKIFQRQLSKEGLQNIVDDKEEVNSLSSKDLKDLFKLQEGTPSDTHDKLGCKRCRIEEAVQSIKDADALAFRRALPKQLELCKMLLDELSTLPLAELFHQHWDPETEGVPAETFANLVHEPMDFGQIAAKLHAVALMSENSAGAPSCGSSGECLAQQIDGGSLSSLAAGHENGFSHDEGGMVPGGRLPGGDGGIETAGIALGAEPRGGNAAGGQAEGAMTVASGSGEGELERPSLTQGQPPQVEGGGGGAVVVPYTTIPAFARDMNLVFANVRRVWPMGSNGSDNRLTKAADSLKLAFDTRWRDLAPQLHCIQRESLEEAREEARAKAIEEATKHQGEDGENGGPPPRFQEQMGMPKEEDLNSWSHHYSTETADDPVFRGAIMGTGDSLVSFVFGLEITWDLMQTRLAADAEAKTLEMKMKAEAKAALAAQKAAAAAQAEAKAEAAEAAGEGGDMSAAESSTLEREGRRRQRKRKRASVIDEDEDDDDGEDSAESSMDLDSDGCSSSDGASAEDVLNVARGAERRSKRARKREDVLLSTPCLASPQRSSAGYDDPDSNGGEAREAWACKGGEGGVDSNAESGSSGRRMDKRKFTDVVDDEAEDAGVQVEIDEEEEHVDVEGTSTGGGTQVEDPPGTETGTETATGSTPTDGECGIRSQSEDEILETPLSGHEPGEEENAVQADVVVNGTSLRGGSGDQLAEWTCPKCTFANAVSRRRCLMCTEGSRPSGMGRVQPLTPRPPHDDNLELGTPRSARQKKGKNKRNDGNGTKKSAAGREDAEVKKPREKRRKREIWIDDDEDYE